MLHDRTVDFSEVCRSLIAGALRVLGVPFVIERGVGDVRVLAVDAAGHGAADHEHGTLRAMIGAVVVLRNAPAELAPYEDGDAVLETAPHVGEIVEEDLERRAELGVQAEVLAILLGAA